MIHRFLILPGYENSGPRHWQSLWERALHNARRVPMPDWDHPHRDEWVATLDEAIRRTPAPPVVIAHSVGVLTLVHWAAVHHVPLHAALLVAPADVASENFPREARGFDPIPMQRLPFRSTLVASSNDPYCTTARAHEFAQAWGSQFADAGAAGHLNSDAGFGPWPAGERLLDQLLA